GSNTLSNLTSGNFSNDGTIEVAGSTTLIIDTSPLDNSSALVQVDALGTLDLASSSIDAGTLSNHGQVETTSGSNTLSHLKSGNFSNDGPIEVDGSTTLILDPDSLDNSSGLVQVDALGTLDLA